ncbi:hypothetical protein ACFL6C_10125 [Myxococcota bacterium]
MRRRKTIGVLGLAVLTVPFPAMANTLPSDAGVFDEFIGVRSAGMGGAHRGLGTSNDTIYLNPAGMAAARRYSVELNYGYSPFDQLTHLNISAVDSKSGPVAGAVSYTHTRGDGDDVDAGLHRVYIAAAYAISDSIALGMTARHIRGEFNEDSQRRELELYGGDIGALIRLGPVGLGVTAHNVIKEEVARMMPLTFGFGAAYSSGPLTVAADFDIDTRKTEKSLRTYRVGGEYFIANAFPLRIGYYHSPFTRRDGKDQSESVITGGAGWVTGTGAVAASFERSIDRARNWSLVACLQFFL